jgi:hypothetical protein
LKCRPTLFFRKILMLLQYIWYTVYIMEYNVIKVKRVTYERLCKLGKYNDTMDDIITRLLDKLSKKGKRGKQ